MSTLIPDSKLMYYPTDRLEVYRICYLLSNYFEYDGSNAKIETRAKYEQHYKRDYYNAAKNLYLELLAEGDFDEIDNCIGLGYGGYYKQIAACDPFAGKAEWLSTLANLCNYGAKVQTVAVEIEKDRFDAIEADYKVNCAFEETQFPPKQIGLLLFNPPYGSTNGVRNVSHYFRQILERKVLDDGAVVVAVIREDDVMEIADAIYCNFDVVHQYRVNELEYQKYKQCVLILKSKAELTMDSPYSLDRFQTFKRKLENDLNSGKGFTPENLRIVFPENRLDLEEKFSQYQELSESREYVSNYDRAWDWVCRDSRAKLSDGFHLTMPRAPRVPEIANLLASGIINGYIDDPDVPHVVSGGVKSIQRQETVIEDNSDGEPVEKLRELRYSQPYLNVLTAKNGKIVIKQIETQ